MFSKWFSFTSFSIPNWIPTLEALDWVWITLKLKNWYKIGASSQFKSCFSSIFSVTVSKMTTETSSLVLVPVFCPLYLFRHISFMSTSASMIYNPVASHKSVHSTTFPIKPSFIKPNRTFQSVQNSDTHVCKSSNHQLSLDILFWRLKCETKRLIYPISFTAIDQVSWSLESQ